MSICTDYSGVIIDQNQTVELAGLGPSQFWYQTFRLPEDLLYGTTASEQKFPGLSGFHLFAAVEDPVGLEVEWRFEERFKDQGWTVLKEGTLTGAQSDGECWLEIFFDSEIPVISSMVPSETNEGNLFRFRFKLTKGVEAIGFATGNFFGGEVLDEEEEKVFGDPLSFGYRILALTADSGTDFLGNPYRSVAIHASADTNSGYWLSKPQPSQFAVVSHYSDLRQTPEKPTFGHINKIPDPSFEYDKVELAPFAWTTESTPSWINPGATAEVVTGQEAPQGVNCLKIITDGNEPDEGVSIVDVTPVGVGVPVTFSVWAKSEGPTFDVRIGLGKPEGEEPEIGIEAVSFTVDGTWTRHEITLTPLATGEINVAVWLEEEAERTFFIDGALLNTGTTAVAYFDGDSPSCKWENQRGRSSSVDGTRLLHASGQSECSADHRRNSEPDC